MTALYLVLALLVLIGGALWAVHTLSWRAAEASIRRREAEDALGKVDQNAEIAADHRGPDDVAGRMSDGSF